MNDPAEDVTISLRIPGRWSGPRDLVARLPPDLGLTPETLTMPDGTEIGFGSAKADGQFAEIFRTSCRRPPSADELATVKNYTVNLFLMGPGGSLDAARTMMRAAAVLVQAGGAGVFIDNCAVAHGGGDWLAMSEDGGPDALCFAFMSIISGKTEVRTIGMHTLGLRDVVMRRVDAESNDFDILEVVRYLANSERPIEDGHLLGDLEGPRYQATVEDAPQELEGSPMHNPFGRLRLVSVREIAESN